MCFSAAIPQDTPVGLPAQFHMPSIIQIPILIQPAGKRCQRRYRLKSRSRLHRTHGRNIVQRRRTHRITQILPLQRFPLFPGNRHSKIIGIKIRCTGHSQDLSRLHVQRYRCTRRCIFRIRHGMISVLTVKNASGRCLFKSLLQSRLRGFLQRPV